jgi:hypothetical protein
LECFETRPHISSFVVSNDTDIQYIYIWKYLNYNIKMNILDLNGNHVNIQIVEKPNEQYLAN